MHLVISCATKSSSYNEIYDDSYVYTLYTTGLIVAQKSISYTFSSNFEKFDHYYIKGPFQRLRVPVSNSKTLAQPLFVPNSMSDSQ